MLSPYDINVFISKEIDKLVLFLFLCLCFAMFEKVVCCTL